MADAIPASTKVPDKKPAPRKRTKVQKPAPATTSTPNPLPAPALGSPALNIKIKQN